MAFGTDLTSDHVDYVRREPLEFYGETWVESQAIETNKTADRALEVSRIGGAVQAVIYAKTACSIAVGAAITLTIQAATSEGGTYATVATKAFPAVSGSAAAYDAGVVIGYAEIPEAAGPWIKVNYSISTPGASSGTVSVVPDYLPR